MKKKIRNLINDIPGWYVREIKIISDTEFNFLLSEVTLKFKDLDLLSSKFGTKEIDFVGETYYGGYCETCSYEDECVRVTIKNYKLED